MPRYRQGITFKTTKRYPRISAGPLRHQYVHRVVAAAMLGRELKKDEEVHHRDGDRLNFHFTNLLILGEYDHGWVSNKQSWFMRQRDGKEKQEWDDFMTEEALTQYEDIAAAKVSGNEWAYRDGHIGDRWENRKGSLEAPLAQP